MTDAEKIATLLADKPFAERLKRLGCLSRKQVAHLQLEYEVGYLDTSSVHKLVEWAEEVALQLHKTAAEFSGVPSLHTDFETDDARRIVVATIYRWQTDAEYLLSLQRMHENYDARMKQASPGDLVKLRAEADRLGLKLVPKDQD